MSEEIQTKIAVAKAKAAWADLIKGCPDKSVIAAHLGVEKKTVEKLRQKVLLV